MDNEMNSPKTTFIVKVEYLQHGTWQGQVIWAEENRHMRFRSALELIKLMDEAMNAGALSVVEQKHSVS